jgi:hypothetical protein
MGSVTVKLLRPGRRPWQQPSTEFLRPRGSYSGTTPTSAHWWKVSLTLALGLLTQSPSFISRSHLYTASSSCFLNLTSVCGGCQ